MRQHTKLENVWLALGKFTFRFAEAEDQLRERVVDYAGGSAETAKIFLRGASVNSLSGLLKGLAASRGQDIPVHVLSALEQLKVLAEVRNLIFHHGPDNVDDGIRTATYSSKAMEKGEVFTATVNDLNTMSSDLLAIRFIMMNMFSADEVDAPRWGYRRPPSTKYTWPRRDDDDRRFRPPGSLK